MSIIPTSFPVTYTNLMMSQQSIGWMMAWAKICLKRLSVHYLGQLDCISANSWHLEDWIQSVRSQMAPALH